jgi:heparin/heparan-sulfate lyase
VISRTLLATLAFALAGACALGAGPGPGAPAAGGAKNDACRDTRFQVDPTRLRDLRQAIPKVPSGHPRVYVRSTDLATIRQKIASPRFQWAWNEVQEGTRHPEIGHVFDAFVYLVRGDRDAGRRAVAGALGALRRSRETLNFGDPFHLAAMAYDWTYDLLTDAEKRAFVAEFTRIAASDPDGPCYPAVPNAPGVVGHVTAGPLLTGQIPVGVAIHDEDPRMYEAAAVAFFNTFKPVRDFSYRGHSAHAGDSYGPTYFVHDQAVSWLFRRLGAGDVLSREQQFVLYRMLYDLRPDGQQLRRGDTHDDGGQHPIKRLSALLAASYYDNPYLLEAATRTYFRSAAPFSGLVALLFQSPSLDARPLSELPLTRYFPEPMGTLVARTGWTMGPDSPDALVSMHVGQYFFGGHQHVGDFGTFQIYYRGALAVASGAYDGDRYGNEHWRHYYHQTISKNGLLVLDGAESRRYQGKPVANDGGTRWPNDGNDHPPSLAFLEGNGYRMGSVLAVEVGPDRARPDYSYIAGDITEAYSAKVRRVTRSMVTFNNRSAVYPATLVVFDRISSSNPVFKKTWLLHSIEEPTVSGRTITVTRTQPPYRGRLVVESLLPGRVVVTKVGGPGRQFWIESTRTNYHADKTPPAESGAWRVEVSPGEAAADDLFLHVLTVADARTASGPPVERLDASALVGAKFLDRAVLFSRTGDLLKSASFAVSAPGALSILVCDLEPGAWSAVRDGTPVGALSPVTAEGKCLAFRGASGRYELSRR